MLDPYSLIPRFSLSFHSLSSLTFFDLLLSCLFPSSLICVFFHFCLVFLPYIDFALLCKSFPHGLTLMFFRFYFCPSYCSLPFPLLLFSIPLIGSRFPSLLLPSFFLFCQYFFPSSYLLCPSSLSFFPFALSSPASPSILHFP